MASPPIAEFRGSAAEFGARDGCRVHLRSPRVDPCLNAFAWDASAWKPAFRKIWRRDFERLQTNRTDCRERRNVKRPALSIRLSGALAVWLLCHIVFDHTRRTWRARLRTVAGCSASGPRMIKRKTPRRDLRKNVNPSAGSTGMSPSAESVSGRAQDAQRVL